MSKSSRFCAFTVKKCSKTPDHNRIMPDHAVIFHNYTNLKQSKQFR